MVKEDWKTVSVKRSIMDEVERMLKAETLRESGITNAAQFVDLAMREKIERLERTRFHHVNMYDDHVKILDNKLERFGRIVSVYFKDARAWCDYCEEHLCVHIQYAWEIPEVKQILERRRIKPPPSKMI